MLVFAESRYDIDTAEKTIPSDIKFPEQSALNAINAPQAWTLAKGSETIAIIDTGVDFSHPDLSSKKHLDGLNLIEGGNINDDNGHGTHVAGIASAQTNNKIGISGVSWGSSILPIKAYDKNGGRSEALRLVKAIQHAARSGVAIINVSASHSEGELEICAAVRYAVSKNAIVVGAAGNITERGRVFPAACPGAAGVSNTDPDSNSGDWVALSAPAGLVLSTVPKRPKGDCDLCDPSGYGQAEGTSMSTPMVSGALAVVMDREPSFSAAQALERLKNTAKPLSDSNLGAGLIDLYAAMFPGSELITDVQFEEPNYKKCVLDGANESPWLWIYIDEVSHINCSNKDISSIKGTEVFKELKSLNISNNNLSNIDLSNHPKLSWLEVSNNNLSSIDLSNNVALSGMVNVSNNNLSSLDLTNKGELIRLDASNNKLSSLNLSNNPKITTLKVSNNNLKDLELSKNNALIWVYASNNNLEIFDLRDEADLVFLDVSNNNLSKLDVTGNTKLDNLYVQNNNLSSLDVTDSTELGALFASNNSLSSLDLSNKTRLYSVRVAHNNLSELDISNATIGSIDASYNNLSSLDVSTSHSLWRLGVANNNLMNIDLTNLSMLTVLALENNSLSSINISNNPKIVQLNIYHNNLSSIDISNNAEISSLDISYNNLSSINIDHNPKLTSSSLNAHYNPFTVSSLDYLKGLGFYAFSTLKGVYE